MHCFNLEDHEERCYLVKTPFTISGTAVFKVENHGPLEWPFNPRILMYLPSAYP